MLPDSAQLRGLIAAELDSVSDPARRTRIQAVLGIPQRRSFRWNYGAPGERLEVWVLGGSSDGNIALVYSDQGFGPQDPWGYVFPTDDSLGMDSQWHVGLEQAAIGAGFLDAPPDYDVP